MPRKQHQPFSFGGWSKWGALEYIIIALLMLVLRQHHLTSCIWHQAQTFLPRYPTVSGLLTRFYSSLYETPTNYPD